MQLVGTNPSVEAWQSERLLQKLRETATLTASERNGLVWCFRQEQVPEWADEERLGEERWRSTPKWWTTEWRTSNR